MATVLTPPRAPKPKAALPSHYHESFLEKKGPRDREYKKYWAGLQGLTLYFYHSNRDFQHVEKLDLSTFMEITDETPWVNPQDPGINFTLILWNQEVKFKVENLESREMWKGFILTVVELRVPSHLTLLPGHLYMMAEVLSKEQARRALEPPQCFLKVSRLEAQLLLERYPECGNLLLRPGGDGAGGVSVTTRQILNGKPVVLHYKVKLDGSHYVIDVEEPHSCTSLDAVVNYFVCTTNRALVPFLLDEDYEKVLGFVEANKENGESVWVVPAVPATPNPGAPATAGGPRQPPAAFPTPMTSQHDRPPVLPLPPLPSEDESENYVTPIGDAPDYENADVSSPSRPVITKPKNLGKTQAKVPKMPAVPKPEPRGPRTGQAWKLAISASQAFVPVTGLAGVTAELEEKLQKRRALENSSGHAGFQ